MRSGKPRRASAHGKSGGRGQGDRPSSGNSRTGRDTRGGGARTEPSTRTDGDAPPGRKRPSGGPRGRKGVGRAPPTGRPEARRDGAASRGRDSHGAGGAASRDSRHIDPRRGDPRGAGPRGPPGQGSRGPRGPDSRSPQGQGVRGDSHAPARTGSRGPRDPDSRVSRGLDSRGSHGHGSRGDSRGPPRPDSRRDTGARSRPGRHVARGAHDEPERLQKVLARAGLASRREVEDWIRAARLTVNGQIATLGVRVGPHDLVRLDGRLVRHREAPRSATAFICHRSPGENLQQPAGVGATGSAGRGDLGADTEVHAGNHGHAGTDAHAGNREDAFGHDEQAAAGRPDDGFTTSVSTWSGEALTERLPRRAGRRFIAVSPMPRIDGGLELVTSDGELAAKLQRSMRNLTSEFSVRVKGELGQDQLASVLEGHLDSGEKLQIETCEASGGEGANRWYLLAARGASGKDIRQLFERQGALVSRVLRTKLGPLVLERSMPRGRFRELTNDELDAITAAGGAAGSAAGTAMGGGTSGTEPGGA